MVNPKEKEIQRLIMDYLKFKKIFMWRNNSGALKTDHGFIRFGDVGSPDVFAVQKGQVYGIEVKRLKSTQSDYQLDWQRRFESSEGVYKVVRSLDDIISLFP